jgi:predicted HTH transcriptional regulator
MNRDFDTYQKMIKGAIMSIDEVIDIIKYGETINLECKKCENGLPKSLWETYSSFANSRGGTIILGVQEEKEPISIDKKFTLIGVNNATKIKTDFWNTINSDKVSANILVDSNVQIVPFDEDGRCGEIICIEVPQASYKFRPVYINENPIKNTYKRNYEGDYHCSEEEVKAMLRDANDAGNDGTLLDGYNMDDIDIPTLRAYRMEYQLRNPDHVWNTIDDKEFLRNLGGYTVERETKREGLTTAGLLMFGKGLSVRERFDNIRMDYIDETHLIGDQRWSDRLTYDGMWENNLYNFLKKVMPKLVSDLKRPFNLNGIVRNDDTLVHKAIREAFVNLIIHSDYLMTGVLKIVKKDSGFIFSNPGTLKLPIQKIYEGGTSKARNPRIQTMLRMIGLGDNVGSGFPTILNAWGQEKWRKPDLSEDEDINQVELKLWMISLMPQESTEYLQNLYGVDYNKLCNMDQIILSTAYVEKEISNSPLQILLEENSIVVGKHLSNLVANGFLNINSKGRWTTYELNVEYETKTEQMQIEDLPEISHNLKGSDKIIYDYIVANGTINLATIMEITKISTKSGAAIACNRLIDIGLIQRVRCGKNVFYKIK